ncbi:MAG: GNAT family N-acetyltransferase, partial [SAR324 cluster bacterium]|nr:GNAT family N-acetyltransferase [SAR324 cluster bacterium]
MNPSTETESFQIRNAFPSDADSIIAFNQAMARETEDRTLEDRIIRAGVQRIFDEPDQGFYLVAESEKRIIGTLMVTREWSDWRNGQFWWIQSVYVEKSFR